jgi:hypothetical protein
LVAPAASPLTIASQEASVSDTLRVRLLSMAQQRQAAITSSAGHASARSTCPGHASNAPPATMASMPKATRRSTFSRNTIHASNAVKTASAFSSSEAVEAGIAASPSISSTGPATPPVSTAAASHLPSPAASRALGARRIQRNVARPSPDPR